jgi:hypothetical protein
MGMLDEDQRVFDLIGLTLLKELLLQLPATFVLTQA